MSAVPLTLPRKMGTLIKTRACTVCEGLIPPERLRAVPNARMCVSCTESTGDVPKLKRIDSSSPSGDTEEVYFTENRYFDEYLSRVNQRVFTEAGADDVQETNE